MKEWGFMKKRRRPMATCPRPGCEAELICTDPNNASHVALGQVVCSTECHAAMYDLFQWADDKVQQQLPLDDFHEAM